MTRAALAQLTFGIVLGVTPPALAATVVVPPGPGTPVQDAIDAAIAGDTIRLTVGVYPEHITITTALKIRGVRSTSTEGEITVLDGTCAPGPVITVAADDVQVRDVAVNQDTAGGIDVQGRSHVKLRKLFVASNCPTVTAPAVNIVQGDRIVLDKVWAAGFGPPPVGTAGIRVADMLPGSRARVRRTIAAQYAVGVLLENNAGSLRISLGDVNYNAKGIVLQGTSGAVVDHLRLVGNTTSGIELDAGSSGNLILRNTISGSTTDVVDAGSGNCWKDNTFTTGSVPPCP